MTDGAADPRMLPDHIGSPMSILTDAEIKQAMDLGYIFRENGDRNFVRQASYEGTSKNDVVGVKLDVSRGVPDHSQA